MILDIHVGAGATPEAVAEALGRELDVPVVADERRNPKLVPEDGLIRIARVGYDRTLVLAEVRSETPALADRVYEALVSGSAWDVRLVDSSDDNPEDVVLRSRIANAA